MISDIMIKIEYFASVQCVVNFACESGVFIDLKVPHEAKFRRLAR